MTRKEEGCIGFYSPVLRDCMRAAPISGSPEGLQAPREGLVLGQPKCNPNAQRSKTQYMLNIFLSLTFFPVYEGDIHMSQYLPREVLVYVIISLITGSNVNDKKRVRMYWVLLPYALGLHSGYPNTKPSLGACSPLGEPCIWAALMQSLSPGE